MWASARVPWQGLKASRILAYAARLKTCPDTRRFVRNTGALALISLQLLLVVPLIAQQTSPAPPQSQAVAPTFDGTFPHPNETKFLLHLAQDQAAIWTSPFHLQPADAKWLVPMGGIAAGLFATDPQSSYAMRLNDAHALNVFSDAGVGAALGATGGAYLWGRLVHDERARETGVLATEAIVNAIGVDYALKGISGRLRPIPSNFQNIFLHGGTSFPSDHSAIMWAFASVVAQEYPHPAAQISAYGLALGASLARAASNQHFLSDVFIGGLMGYQIGRHIYKVRHNPEIDDDLKIVAEQTSAPRPGNFASVNVPLDSWIYPAMERLIGNGYIDTAFLGLRPWTRMSCARMLVEMNSKVEFHTDVPSEIWKLKKVLDEEFAPELATLDGRPSESLQLDSLYTRVMDIAGTPVNDSYHFGQTLINDYGRPYWQGVNNITGFSASANDGRFAFYVNGEYQHAPTIPGYPLSVRQVIADVDVNPLQPPTPISANYFRLLDTYGVMKYGGLDFSVGKQSMWWGPGESGAMLMSDNAAPFWMLQINRMEPTNIPGLSKLLGPFEVSNYFGALAGHQFPAGPYIFGQKVSFKPTPNLEFGFTRNDVFGGAGHVPLTFGSFWNSFTSFNDVSPGVKFSRNDPGARHASFDASYRLPLLGRSVTIYTDSIVHDDVNPISAPQRAGFNPGIYFARVPGLPKLDFRAEAVYTDPPTIASQGGHFIYWEVVYHDLYLNNRYLMGSWIGREGKGYQAWTTYHLSPRSSIQLAVRNAKIANDFIPGGSTQWDWNVSGDLWVHKNFEIKPFLQYETWLIPVLAPTRQTNFTTSVQITWWPTNAGVRRPTH
jgi:membrane-associated phospholipid phosphatase